MQLVLSEIDSVLKATLEVDDFIDLTTLLKETEIPAFQSQYSQPLPPPSLMQAPSEPHYVEPPEPKAIVSLLRGKKKHAAEVEAARAEYSEAYEGWRTAVAALPAAQHEQLSRYAAAEQDRMAKLDYDRQQYAKHCDQVQKQVDESNKEIKQLMDGLESGEPAAVEKYFQMVFVNSQYPSELTWTSKCKYDNKNQELSIELELPSPKMIPTTRQFKYIKAKDEITSVEQTLKEQRERYARLINNMTLRTLHEVWESDRGGKVETISLTGFVNHISSATGQNVKTPMVAVASTRSAFEEIDLKNVESSETMQYLNAVVSKDARSLKPIAQTIGVRTNRDKV